MSILVGDVAVATAAAPDKSLLAVKLDDTPTVDGKLDDPVWQQVRFVADFVQKQPEYGAPPSRRTEVAVTYDEEALYVGARMYARGPDDLQAVMTRRDVTGSAERIIISLDTFLDRRTAYSFAVTAAGVRADWYHPDDDEFSRDASFNPVWTAQVATDDTGWTAEMRIPFTQLRFPPGDTQRWGININRYIPQRNEDIFWIPVPKDETAWSSRFGELEGLANIRQPLRLEVVPYVAGDMTLRSDQVAARQGESSRTSGYRGGVDVAMGLGPNVTLNATVLPDFGQVEADPAEVNLSAFETYFAEQRPFFTEGSQLLEGQGKSFYYSRRIGESPRSCASRYQSCPASTPILGAAKVTSRLPSGLSIGTLAALTGEADARDMATGERVLVAPLSGYGAFRAQHEFGPDASVAGVSLTGVTRQLDPGDRLAGELVRHSIAGGADWKLRFAGGAYQLRGDLGFTHLRGEPAAIDALARNPVHYFQRPDQGHVALDPGRRSMSGWAATLGVDKRHGDWLWDVTGSFESPGFDPNEVGRLQSADDISLYGGGRYRDTEPGDVLQSWLVGLYVHNEWNFSGVADPGYRSLYSSITWKNFWVTEAQLNLMTPGQSDHATRGGPLMGTGWGGEGVIALSSPYAGRHRWSGWITYTRQQIGQSGIQAQSSLELQPLERLRVALTPRYWRRTDNRQYVATMDDSYIFGTIERRELSVQTRVQVAFTPDLALDAYLEPFASSGRYVSFGALAAPGSRELLDGPMIDGRDFTYLSLRSTAVMRWEFSPGSTLFLVWQQNRSHQRDMPGGVLSSLGDTFTAPGATTLAAKLTYWLSADRVRSLVTR